jgi:3-carboxy-cis,cis-muconate cycloisomerase
MMSFSPFDHHFLSGLLGDGEIAGYLSAEADIRAILSFESALARAQAGIGVIPTEAANRISIECLGLNPNVEQLGAAVARDSVVVPELVKQLREAVGGSAATHVHFGATSQDAIDTSLMLRLQTIVQIFADRTAEVVDFLHGLERRFGDCMLMGKTRMQAAIPIHVSDRLRSWRDPLERSLKSLEHLEFPVQFGGAAGSLDKLGEHGAAVRAALAKELGLADIRQWQSQRDPVVAIGHYLSLLTGALGKIGQDIALMAQASGEGEISLEGGGTSSAMAHKQNPVAAETLVALARFNAVQVSGLHQSLVHEQERSGAAWTLEWLILPHMVMATAASLRLSMRMLASIKRMGTTDLP